MSSLFMPKELEERDLLTKMDNLDMDVYGDVLIVAHNKGLYLLDNFNSQPQHLHDFMLVVNALGHYNDNLFIGAGQEMHVIGSEGNVNPDWMYQSRPGKIHDFCEYDGVLYDAGDYGTYKTLNKGGHTDNQYYHSLCNHGGLLGGLWHGIRNLSSDTVYHEEDEDWEILGMCSIMKDLYFCGATKKNHGFVRAVGDNSVKVFREFKCVDVFSFGGSVWDTCNVHDICARGKVHNTKSQELVYDFKKPVTAITTFPRKYLHVLEELL